MPDAAKQRSEQESVEDRIVQERDDACKPGVMPEEAEIHPDDDSQKEPRQIGSGSAFISLLFFVEVDGEVKRLPHGKGIKGWIEQSPAEVTHLMDFLQFTSEGI